MSARIPESPPLHAWKEVERSLIPPGAIQKHVNLMTLLKETRIRICISRPAPDYCPQPHGSLFIWMPHRDMGTLAPTLPPKFVAHSKKDILRVAISPDSRKIWIAGHCAPLDVTWEHDVLEGEETAHDLTGPKYSLYYRILAPLLLKDVTEPTEHGRLVITSSLWERIAPGEWHYLLAGLLLMLHDARISHVDEIWLQSAHAPSRYILIHQLLAEIVRAGMDPYVYATIYLSAIDLMFLSHWAQENWPTIATMSASLWQEMTAAAVDTQPPKQKMYVQRITNGWPMFMALGWAHEHLQNMHGLATTKTLGLKAADRRLVLTDTVRHALNTGKLRTTWLFAHMDHDLSLEQIEGMVEKLDRHAREERVRLRLSNNPGILRPSPRTSTTTPPPPTKKKNVSPADSNHLWTFPPPS